MTDGSAELAADLIAVINSRDRTELEPLLDPEVEVITGRNVHSGSEAAASWVGKEYDNLARRYAVDELREREGRVLALGSVQYVWKEGGDVADSSPIALELEFSGGRLLRLRLHDDVAAALSSFIA